MRETKMLGAGSQQTLAKLNAAALRLESLEHELLSPEWRWTLDQVTKFTEELASTVPASPADALSLAAMAYAELSAREACAPDAALDRRVVELASRLLEAALPELVGAAGSQYAALLEHALGGQATDGVGSAGTH